jgi:hypothetical protein
VNELRPRRVAHRGVVEAKAFVFDERLLGAREARRRVVDAWAPGVEVFRCGDLLVLRLAQPVRVSMQAAPGTPLVESRGALLAAPLDAPDREVLTPRSGDMVLVEGGVARVVPLLECPRERPEEWLDLERFRLVETVSLGAEPAPPRVVAEPEPFDGRAKLGNIPAETSEMRELIAELARRREVKDTADGREGKGFDVGSWLARVFVFLARLLGRVSPPSGRTASAAGPRAEPSPSFFDRLAARFDRLAMWLLRTSRLGALLGRRQAEYIARMIEMFESGDMANALRHAIPLGSLDGLDTRSRPAYGVPSPRASLNINPWRGRAGSSIGMGLDLMTDLRTLYRAAYERLAAQGRIEEAAFVLAELLKADEEAVAFLERHGKLRLAAEMAEARGLPPGLVVRQWFVAGDRDRAVAVARRTGAFADAVLRMERENAKDATLLRVIWATALALAGDYARAVDAAWPVEEARPITLGWLDRAVEAGGVAGARMLAKRLGEAPTSESVKLALAMLDDEEREGLSVRAALATALVSGTKTATTRAVARAAARTLLRDGPLGGVAGSEATYKGLVAMAEDGALRSDAPPLVRTAPGLLRARTEPICVRIERGDAGVLPIADAVFLPNGWTVVALGEAGARLVGRDGRVVAAFDQPAHRLVVSDNGDRAIALAPRGEVWRLARLDFLRRKAEAWCEAKIDAWADSYDGSMWFLGARGDFYAIDATARRFDALWRVPEVGFGTLAVGRDATAVSFLAQGRDFETWRYELPTLRLKARDVASSLVPEALSAPTWMYAISPDATVADLTWHINKDVPGDSLELLLRLHRAGAESQNIRVGSAKGDSGAPSMCGGLVAGSVVSESGVGVRVVGGLPYRVLIDVELEGARMASARVREDAVTIADDRGRLLVFDVGSGTLVRDIRLYR